MVAFKERIPVKIGATADPFPMCEVQEHITYDCLRVFNRYDYPVQISTKNPAVFLQYADRFRNANIALNVSCSFCDDDIYTFYEMDDSIGKKVKIEDGNKLYRLMERVARFGLECGFSDIGVDGATWLNGEEARKVTRQVFVCHNLPSDDTFIPWRGRMADDLVQAIDTERTSRGIQLSVKWFGYAYAQSATASGGNTDLYNAEGYIRKAGYINLVGPACCKVGFDEKRKPHIRMSYPAAKIVHEKYQR